ncbi:MAG: YraN family protein [Sphaerobacter sp.]|nr:YraN family protein [Sphaerobacter sp.]
MHRRRLGDAGERFAEHYVTRRGWRVLARQWRGASGEVDLVALDGDVLVLVEVKTRRGARFGAAEEAVDPAKAERLLALGEEFVAAHPEHSERVWRVDLVAITLDARGAVERVTHVPDAYQTG